MIAAFASWHGAHDRALAIVNASPALAAHSAIEAYSVLTRLPAPNRGDPIQVRAFLAEAFPDDYLTLPGRAIAALLDEFVALGIEGGATYDGLIGATVRAAGATLYTCDRRARSTYERLGVEVRFLA